MKKNNIIIKCDCYGHAIELEYNKATNDIEVSLWNLGSVGRVLDWKQRFRWILRIIWTGNPWADMVILSDDKFKDIINWYNGVKGIKKQLLNG